MAKHKFKDMALVLLYKLETVIDNEGMWNGEREALEIMADALQEAYNSGTSQVQS